MDQSENQKPNQWLAAFVAIGLAGVLIGASLASKGSNPGQTSSYTPADRSQIEVLSQGATALPIVWGDTSHKLTASGVIDAEKFVQNYARQGGLSTDERELLYGTQTTPLIITKDNAGIILNLFWAFGLASANPILEEGPMTDSRYGGPGAFASTGGWTLTRGNVMDHYGTHSFVILSAEQQALVEKVAKNIYRPCCDNPTYFPDCNHGMAMLGLLQMLASQGATEREMYKTALVVNSYWFPGVYETIARYVEGRGDNWQSVDSKIILGKAYSSASGYRGILAEIEPPTSGSGGGCSV